MKKSKILILSAIIITGMFPVTTYGEEDILLDHADKVIVLDDDDILSPNYQVSEEPFVTAEQPAPTPAATAAMILPQATSVNTPALIVVYRLSNICIVYDKAGQVVNSFVVSTGRKGHNTPLGTYKIYEHSTSSGYHLMVDGTYGRWCMRFKQGGYMFHSVCYAQSGDKAPIAQEVADLGTSVSRGCVRLSVTDAEWLYKATPNGCLVNIVNK